MKGKWLLKKDGAAYKLEIAIGQAIGLDICGCVRICSILPVNKKSETTGSEAGKPIIGAKNIVSYLIKTKKAKSFDSLLSSKAVFTENVFEKTSLVYLSDISANPDLVD